MSIPLVSVSDKVKAFQDLSQQPENSPPKRPSAGMIAQDPAIRGVVKKNIQHYENLQAKQEAAAHQVEAKRAAWPSRPGPRRDAMAAPRQPDEQLQQEHPAYVRISKHPLKQDSQQTLSIGIYHQGELERKVDQQSPIPSSAVEPIEKKEYPVHQRISKLRLNLSVLDELPVLQLQPIENKANASCVEEMVKINDVLDEKDSNGRFKRYGKYYTMLREGSLSWKPYTNEKLTKAERKQAIQALKFLLQSLNNAYDGGVQEVPSKVYEDLESLNRVLDKVIDREWCQAILMQKKHQSLRKSVITFLHRYIYSEPLEEAKQIHASMQSSKPMLTRLMNVLAALQMQAACKEHTQLIERGLESVKKTEVSEELPGARQKAVQACSPRLQEMLRERERKRNEAVANNKALREGFIQLAKEQKEEIVKSLGIGSGYHTLNGENETANYVLRSFSKPDELTGCYDEHSLSKPAETLVKCEANLKEYIDLHQSWLDSDKRLRRFIKESLTGRSPLTGRNREERQIKAKAAYKMGQWAECLRIVFHNGKPHLEFAALLKDLFKRSLFRLKEQGISQETLNALQSDCQTCMGPPSQWQSITTVLKSLLVEFENLHLA